MSIPRTYSEKYLRGHSDMDLFSNRNTDWMNYPFAKLSYIVLLAIVLFVLHTSQLFGWADTWTVLNMMHGVVSAYSLFRCSSAFINNNIYYTTLLCRLPLLYSTGSRATPTSPPKENTRQTLSTNRSTPRPRGPGTRSS